MIDDRYPDEADEKAAQSSAMMLALRDAVVSVLMLGVRFWWLMLPLVLLAAAWGGYRLWHTLPQAHFGNSDGGRNFTVLITADSTASARTVGDWMRGALKGGAHVYLRGDSLRPTQLSGTVLWPLGDELESGGQVIIGLQPFLSRLGAGDALTGIRFLEALTTTLDDDVLGPPVGAEPALQALSQALDETGSGPVSWGRFVREKDLRDSGKLALYFIHRGDAALAERDLRETMRQASERFGVQIALTGNALWALEESRLVEQRLWLTTGILIIGFLLVGLAGVHDLRFAAGLGGLIGLWLLVQGIWLTVSDVISLGGQIGLGFGLLLLAITGFDLLLRSRDAEAVARAPRDGMRTAMGERIGAFAQVFTMCLLALLAFDFFAYGELARFSRAALFSTAISAGFIFFVVPAFMPVVGAAETASSTSPMRLLWAGVAGLSFAFGRSVVMLAVLLVLFGVVTAPLFTPALTLSERMGELDSVKTHEALLDVGIGSPWNLTGEVGDERTASSLATRLEQSPAVQEVVWAGALISHVSTRGRGLLADMQVLMSIDPESPDTFVFTGPSAFNGAAWSALRTALLRVQDKWSDVASLKDISKTVLDRMTAFEDRVGDPGSGRDKAWADVEARLLGDLPNFWRDVQREVSEVPPSRREAARALEGTWVTDRGGYRIEVVPTFSIDDMAGKGEFVRVVRSQLPKAEGVLLKGYERLEVLTAIMFKAVGSALLMVALIGMMFSCKRIVSLGVVVAGAAVMLVSVGLSMLNDLPLAGEWLALMPAMGLLVVATGTLALHRIVLYEPEMGNLLLSSTGRGVIMVWAMVFVIGMAFWVSAHPAVSAAGTALMVGSMVGPFLGLVVIASAFAPTYSVSEG